MSKNEQGAGKTGSETVKFEDDILEFLDKEIATSAKVDPSADTNQDEVDLLVNRLLQQSLAVSDQQENAPEVASMDPRLSHSDLAGVPEVISEPLSIREAQETRHDSPRIDANPWRSTVSDEAPVFSIAPRQQAWGGSVWIMAGAFACLLAGMGIVYLTGFRNGAPAKSDKQASVESMTTPPETETQPMIKEIPGEPSGNAASQRPVQVAASPVPAAETHGTAKNPLPPKKEVPTVPQPTPRLENSSSLPVTAPAVASTDTLHPTSKAADEAAATSAPHPSENMPPPQVFSTQLPAASTSAQLVPNVNPNLQALSARYKLPIPPAPLSKTVVPAEVVTKVAPIYSELARRTRTTGTVAIDVLVDETGKVAKTTAVSGPSILHQDAINAVQQWRFKPASVDGTSVSSTCRVTVVFKQP